MLEFEMEQNWITMPLAIVDVETTGLDTAADRIVEIGIFSVDSSRVVMRWTQLVAPGLRIPRPAAAVHGITDEMVEGSPAFRDIKWEIYHRLRGRLFVAYNGLGFDLPVLTAEMTRCGLTLPIQPILDPLLWQLRPTGQGPFFPVGLMTASRRLGIENAGAHRVTGDCEALTELTFRLSKQVPERLGDLLEAQARWTQQLSAWREQRGALRSDRPTTQPNAQGALPLTGDERPRSDDE